MQDIVNSVSSLGTIELIVIFVVGVTLCYFLGTAPSLVSVVILSLSLLAGIKVYSGTGSFLLAIPTFVITGGSLTFFAFLGKERYRAGKLGFSSVKGMYTAEMAAMEKASSTMHDESQNFSEQELEAILSFDPSWSYTTAHPLFGVAGSATPLTEYELKKVFLRTPPLQQAGWTMERLISAEERRVDEILNHYARHYPEDLRRISGIIVPLLEDNLASGDPAAIKAFAQVYEAYKDRV